MTMEQFHPQAALEFLQGHARGRLGDRHFLRGVADASQARNGVEYAHLFESDFHINISDRSYQ